LNDIKILRLDNCKLYERGVAGSARDCYARNLGFEISQAKPKNVFETLLAPFGRQWQITESDSFAKSTPVLRSYLDIIPERSPTFGLRVG